MNSPFGKKMFDKNPISALQQNAFNAARIAAIEKGADTFKVGDKTFQVKGKKSSINMGSPFPKHKKLEKQLEILKNDPEKAVKKGLSTEGQGGKDFEAIQRLEEKIKEEEAKHTSERTESDDAQIREDEDAARGAAMEMAPLKKNISPLDMGGYAGGGDIAGANYVSTAGAYQNMFNQITEATNKAVAGLQDPEKEAKRLGKRLERMEGRKQTDGRKRRQENVKGKIAEINKSKEAKQKAQQDYNTWLVGAGANASEQEKKNYRESLGLS